MDEHEDRAAPHNPGSDTWSLYCCDRNERWFPYFDSDPSCEVSPLLAEIDADPTGIFWG